MDSLDIARWRLAALRLVGTPFETAADVVSWLGCVQAQDLAGALTSVALRTRARSRDEVTTALAERQIVRSWPMRGTLHFAPAADIGWMTALTHPRTFRQAAKRRESLGIDDAMIEQAWELFAAAFAERGPLARPEVLELWEPLAVAEVSGRGYHLLSVLCEMGRMAQGPVTTTGRFDGCFVALADWVAEPNELPREEALGRWATMFFTSHGPATLADFTRWTGLTVGDARAGLAAATGLVRVESGGTECWMDPGTPDRATAAADEIDQILLLPGFDELILGYADRTATLAKDHEELVVPGRNGVFKPTIIDKARAVGTWSTKAATRTLPARLETVPFGARPPAQKRLAAAFEKLPS